MQKLFRYGVSETMDVTGEKVAGVVIDCGASTAADALAAINDLRHIQVDMYVEENGRGVKNIHSGHLDEILTGLYAQEIEYELSKKGFGLSYRFYINFKGTLALRPNQVLKVRLDVGAAAFTGLDTGKSASYVKAYTIPSNGVASAIACTTSKTVNNGNIDIDMALGSNIYRVVAAMDFTAIYTASTKAKFAADINITGLGFKSSLPKEAVETKNIFMFDDNPESDVAQLVLFKADRGVLLKNGHLTGRLDKVADEYARIIVEHFERF